MGLSLRGKMPMAADGAKIGVALTLDPNDQSGIKRIRLRAVAPLAGAAALTFFDRRLFHRLVILSSMTRSWGIEGPLPQ